MKLLPYCDADMIVEKLHIYDEDIYGAETKKISRFKVEKEVVNYLRKYHDCLASFSMAMTKYHAYTFLFFQFGEEGKELESALREMKEIYDEMKMVNKNKESIILSILNNDQLETIHLEHISDYRWALENIFDYRPFMEKNNNKHIVKDLARIKKCFEDNSDNHFTDAAKEAMKGIDFSYYENNKAINLLSKKIAITDDKGSLFTLPENWKMDIDEAEKRAQRDTEDVSLLLKILTE